MPVRLFRNYEEPEMTQDSTSRSGDALSDVDDQISFVLDHPHMSDWIKRTLASALACSPIQLLNDLEVLNQILRTRSALLINSDTVDAVSSVRDPLQAHPRPCRKLRGAWRDEPGIRQHRPDPVPPSHGR